MLLTLAATSATRLASSPWVSSPRPTARELAQGKAEGEVVLWDSVRPRARPVALWELKLFFTAEEDPALFLRMDDDEEAPV